MYPSLEEQKKIVVQWAEDRGLLKDITPDRIQAQALKVIEEVGETAGALLKKNEDALKDGVGDIGVTLILLAEMTGHDLDFGLEAPLTKPEFSHLFGCLHIMIDSVVDTEYDWISYSFLELQRFADSQCLSLEGCLYGAYLVISKRTGKMIGDTFVKDEEPKPAFDLQITQESLYTRNQLIDASLNFTADLYKVDVVDTAIMEQTVENIDKLLTYVK